MLSKQMQTWRKMMIAIREIQEVKSGGVTVALPPDFHATCVEIIILPVEEPTSDEQDLQTLLLNAPTLTDEELHEFHHVREWMNQWDVKEF
jgi:hypothetical protein